MKKTAKDLVIGDKLKAGEMIRRFDDVYGKVYDESGEKALSTCTHCGVEMDGTCVVFRWGLSLSIYAHRRNIKFAVLYYNINNPVAISTGVDLWNGKDHGIFEPYLADARIKRTPEMCVDLICSKAPPGQRGK